MEESEGEGEEDIVDDEQLPNTRRRLVKEIDALPRAALREQRTQEGHPTQEEERSQEEEPTQQRRSQPSRNTRQGRKRMGLQEESPSSERSVGSFIGRHGRAVQPPWSSLSEAQATVGRRVRVYWGGDRRWYGGKIVLIHPTSRQAFIKYDDHDERWHAMWEECYELLDDKGAVAARNNIVKATAGLPR